MSKRERHAILVRLLSQEQRTAIERHAHATRTSPSESLSAALRRILLEAAGRADLDREVVPLAERARLGGFASSAERARIEKDVAGDVDRRID